MKLRDIVAEVQSLEAEQREMESPTRKRLPRNYDRRIKETQDRVNGLVMEAYEAREQARSLKGLSVLAHVSQQATTDLFGDARYAALQRYIVGQLALAFPVRPVA